MTRTIKCSNAMRIVVADEADLGVRIRTEERLPGATRFRLLEETLIPREHVSEVAHVMLKAVGAINISWEV